MRRNVLQLLALAPIPVILALVIWAGDRDGRSRSATAEPAPAKAEGQQGADILQLPEALPSGWRRSGASESYDKQTLFDRINGAAPTYLDAGFVSLLGAEYSRADVKEPVVVDCYDMGSPSRALGIYSSERDLSYTFIAIGQGAYLSAGTLNYWQGRYYLKLAGYGEGEAMDKALTELAADVAALLPGPAREPALDLLGRLPAAGQVPHSAGYSHAPLGQIPGLAQAYYASYGAPDARYQLFILQAADAKASGERLAQARQHYQAAEAPVVEGADGELTIVTVGQPPRGLIIQRGLLNAGALELPRPELVPEVLGQLRASLAQER